jgi:hypothetical protein
MAEPWALGYWNEEFVGCISYVVLLALSGTLVGVRGGGIGGLFVAVARRAST